MLDDLRKGGGDDFDDFEEEDNSATVAESADDDGGGKGFLGLSPVERMLLSIMVFLVVLVFGVLLLIVSGRIQL